VVFCGKKKIFYLKNTLFLLVIVSPFNIRIIATFCNETIKIGDASVIPGTQFYGHWFVISDHQIIWTLHFFRGIVFISAVSFTFTLTAGGATVTVIRLAIILVVMVTNNLVKLKENGTFLNNLGNF